MVRLPWLLGGDLVGMEQEAEQRGRVLLKRTCGKHGFDRWADGL